MAGHVYTSQELITLLDKCKGLSLGTLDTQHLFDKVDVDRINGIAGNIIEQSVLQYESNSNQTPDLIVDDQPVELKTTGLKKTTRKPYYAAKERLTITAVSPRNIINEDFETSHFYQKTNRLLFIYYFYNSTKVVHATEYANFIFQDYQFFSFTGNDLAEIKREWTMIRDTYQQFVNDYKSDAARNQLRNLNYLEVVAKKTNPRIAISQKYFNVIVRQFFGEEFEPILKEVTSTSFEDTVIAMFKPFVGMTQAELGLKLGVVIPKQNPKAVNPQIARKILKLQTDVENAEEFQKAGIAVKVLTITENTGRIRRTKEALKIENFFDFTEIVNGEWDESKLHDYLFDTKFLLVVFELVNGVQIFRGVKFWQVPFADLDGLIKQTWLRTQNTLKHGVTLTYKPANSEKGYTVSNDLPAIADKTIMHVRPDAAKAAYQEDKRNAMYLPTPAHWVNRPDNLHEELSNDYMTKQAFWLNNEYMFKQVSDLVE